VGGPQGGTLYSKSTREYGQKENDRRNSWGGEQWYNPVLTGIYRKKLQKKILGAVTGKGKEEKRASRGRLKTQGRGEKTGKRKPIVRTSCGSY